MEWDRCFNIRRPLGRKESTAGRKERVFGGQTSEGLEVSPGSPRPRRRITGRGPLPFKIGLTSVP